MAHQTSIGLLNRLTLRAMVASDLPDIVRVEKEAFPLDAWGLEDYEDFLVSRNRGGTVALIDGKIVGHTMHEVHWNRVHLASIAVDRIFRGRGIGTVLLVNLISALASLDRTRLSLEVRLNNSGAIKLYGSHGFQKVRIKRNYYLDGADALYMALDAQVSRARR